MVFFCFFCSFLFATLKPRAWSLRFFSSFIFLYGPRSAYFSSPALPYSNTFLVSIAYKISILSLSLSLFLCPFGCLLRPSWLVSECFFL
ncbi:hypothetical protein DFJ73DRAFT_855819 [Zopfochytrium polystomum]|nr:hypothetical protein DFJ73DRAFT_855819 [Zopfochytrium polystomum]